MSVFTSNIANATMQAMPVLLALVRGEKVRDSTSWATAQLNAIALAGVLPESVVDYFQNDNPGIERSDISVSPVAEVSWRMRAAVQKVLRSTNIHNVEIIGVEEDDRASIFNDGTVRFPDADNLVFIKGGIAAMYRLVRAVHHNAKTKNPEDRKLIIIQNDEGYWTPLLKAFDLLSSDATHYNTLRGYGIIVTGNTKDTRAALQQHGKDISRKPSIPVPGWRRYQQGVDIIPVTSNDQKIGDQQIAINHQGYKATIHNLRDLMGYVFSSEEMRGTFSGNTWDKIKMAMNRLLVLGEQAARESNHDVRGLSADEKRDLYWRLGYGKIIENAEDLDNGVEPIDPRRLIMLANDTGLYIDVYHNGALLTIDLATQKEFAAARDYAVAGKPFPGVELNHVLDALGGAEGFFKQLKAFKERYESQNGGSVTFKAHNVSTYIAVPLVEQYQDITPVSSFADITHEIRVDPPPGHSGPHTTDHYLVSNDPHADGKVIGQIDRNKAVLLLPDARALDVLMQQLGVAKLTPLEMAKKNAQSINIKRRPRVMGYKDLKKIDWSRPGHSFLELCKGYDAFVFPAHGFDPAMLDDDPVIAQRKLAYIFKSFIVGRQVRQHHIHGKILACPDIEKPGHPFYELWQGLQHLRRFHLVKQLNHLLIDHIGHEDAVPHLVRAGLLRIPRPKPSSFEEERYGQEDQPEEARPNIFRVAVLGSASSKQPAHLKALEQCLYDIMVQSSQECPIEFRDGGGRYGIMGESYKVIAKLRNASAAMGFGRILHTVIQCLDTLHLEGCYPDAFSKDKRHPDDQAVIHDCIFKREDEILDVDCVLAFPGGAGTEREVEALILMRHAICNKRGIPNNELPLIIVNVDGWYDVEKKHLGQKFCKDNNIIFVDTGAKAADPVLKLWDEWKKRQSRATIRRTPEPPRGAVP